MRSAAIAGWAIILIFFGGFGAWAVTAPLHGAVVANGFVRVEGNRKSIQHLDGGIVKELNVKEGDRVNAGDVLIVLDDTQARAEYNVLSQQLLVLRATEERLKAELAGASSLTMPEDLKAAGNEHPTSPASGTVKFISSRAVSPPWRVRASSSEKRLPSLKRRSSAVRRRRSPIASSSTPFARRRKAWHHWSSEAWLPNPAICSWSAAALGWRARPPKPPPTSRSRGKRSPSRCSRRRSWTMTA
jgi:multidrug resistance efflux pump